MDEENRFVGVVNGRGRFAVHDNLDNRRWLDCLFARCDGVKLEGVTLRDPSFWTCYFSACTNVVARRSYRTTPQVWSSTDAISKTAICRN